MNKKKLISLSVVLIIILSIFICNKCFEIILNKYFNMENNVFYPEVKKVSPNRQDEIKSLYNKKNVKKPKICKETYDDKCVLNDRTMITYVGNNMFITSFIAGTYAPSVNTKCSEKFSWCEHDYWDGAIKYCEKKGMKLANNKDLIYIYDFLFTDIQKDIKLDYFNNYISATEESISGASSINLNTGKMDLVSKNNKKNNIICVYKVD